jgi:nicotinate-nucleotide adenylyltransferase
LKPTGLFFGSFNPIHIGHLIIANYMLVYGDLAEVWFVISPQNPFKQKESLLADHHRYALVNIAIEDEPRFKASDIEFKMPQPSYTIDTLTYLQEKYPQKQFVLLIGSDQLPSFHRWKNYEQILDVYSLYVYPRPAGDSGEYADHPHVKRIEAPMMEISSSFIREAIKNRKDVRYFLPAQVWDYIREMHFYE